MEGSYQRDSELLSKEKSMRTNYQEVILRNPQAKTNSFILVVTMRFATMPSGFNKTLTIMRKNVG